MDKIKLELSKEEIKLVQIILKELKKQTSIEEKIVFLENIIKKIKNKTLKSEIQKLIRVLQNRLMKKAKSIEEILGASTIPLTQDIDVPIIKEIEALTPLDENLGFSKSMSDKETKSYFKKIDYLSKNQDNSSNDFLSYKVNEATSNYLQEDENSYLPHNLSKKPKTDKEPEPYIISTEKDKNKEKKFGQIWEDL